jgi:hypothetical protein
MHGYDTRANKFISGVPQTENPTRGVRACVVNTWRVPFQSRIPFGSCPRMSILIPILIPHPDTNPDTTPIQCDTTLLNFTPGKTRGARPSTPEAHSGRSSKCRQETRCGTGGSRSVCVCVRAQVSGLKCQGPSERVYSGRVCTSVVESGTLKKKKSMCRQETQCGTTAAGVCACVCQGPSVRAQLREYTGAGFVLSSSKAEPSNRLKPLTPMCRQSTQCSTWGSRSACVRVCVRAQV